MSDLRVECYSLYISDSSCYGVNSVNWQSYKKIKNVWCLYSFQIMLIISSLLYPFYRMLYSQEFVLQSLALCLPCLCVVIHTSFVICWVVCFHYDQFIFWNPGNIYILEIFCPTSSLNRAAVFGITYFYDIDLIPFHFIQNTSISYNPNDYEYLKVYIWNNQPYNDHCSEIFILDTSDFKVWQ